MKAANVLNTIGGTPHIRLGRLFPDAEVWVKSERANPGGSIKDRIALSMVEAAEADGRLAPGGTIIEPTSGNTGVGLAMVAAVKGYKLVLVMPESMSVERRYLMQAYGASFDLTPRERGMKGAIERAQALVAETPGSWMPQQFENPANIAIHAKTTAQEILAGLPGGLRRAHHRGRHGRPHHRLRPGAEGPMARPGALFAVEPTLSPVISGGAPAPHPIQGIGAGFVPANPAYQPAGRRDPGLGGRRQGLCPSVGAGRGAAGRHLVRRDAGGHCRQAPRSAGWRPRARL